MTLIKSREDFDWLFDTHLAAYRCLFDGQKPAFVCAILFGNEDCPETIDLFSEDHYRAPCLRFTWDDESRKYSCVGVVRE